MCRGSSGPRSGRRSLDASSPWRWRRCFRETSPSTRSRIGSARQSRIASLARRAWIEVVEPAQPWFAGWGAASSPRSWDAGARPRRLRPGCVWPEGAPRRILTEGPRKGSLARSVRLGALASMHADRHLHHLPGDLRRARSARACLGRAAAAGILDIRIHDIRDQTTDPHHQVDDEPFGGGPGMVMMAEPLFRAVEALGPDRGRTIVLSPAGRRLDQPLVRELADGGVAGARLWALRGDRRTVRRGAAGGGDLDRRLRALGRRASRARPPRSRDAAGSRRDRQRGVARAGLVRRGRHPRPSALHAAARVPGDDGSRRAPVGEPRRDRAVAPDGGPGEDPAEPSRPLVVLEDGQPDRRDHRPAIFARPSTFFRT